MGGGPQNLKGKALGPLRPMLPNPGVQKAKGVTLAWEGRKWEGGLHVQHISGGKAGILKGSENTEYRWSLAVSGKERPCIERKKKPKVRCT